MKSFPEEGRRRVVIESVAPAVDAGRFPVKRVVGDRLRVEADVFADGHDALRCVLRHRKRGARSWEETEMALINNDRWHGAFDLTELGQLTIANFVNEPGLKPLGDNLFAQTAASGEAIVAAPGDPGFATIKQAYLESSNVDSVKEITDLISEQRKLLEASRDLTETLTERYRAQADLFIALGLTFDN